MTEDEPAPASSDDGEQGKTGFERDVLIDEPGIVGARWWHKSLIEEDAALRRRAVLRGAAIVGGIALAGVGIVKLVESQSDSVEMQNALALQKQYGWDVGARGVMLAFDGTQRVPFDRAALSKLADVLKPKRFAPFYAAALLESLDAAPTAVMPFPTTLDDDGPSKGSLPAFHKLSEIVLPYENAAMRRAYLAGEALARLSAGRSRDTAVYADLRGAEAAAFAAGASSEFEPVLLFDNWPHPRGVVASHMTLAALAYYQPRFAKQASLRSAKDVMPVFVVDRDRATRYSEESDRFDNRYFAKMPSAARLAELGVKHLFYVVPRTSDLPELDDLNEALAGMAPTIDARPLAVDEFSGISSEPLPPDGERPLGSLEGFHYGGSVDTDPSLWVNYPWGPPPEGTPLPVHSSLKDYKFVLRASLVDRPTGNFGKVAVLFTGGVVVGTMLRRGSMGRSSGGWGG